MYEDGDREDRRTILKRLNGVLGVSHEKQSLPPKLKEHEKMGYGYVSS